MHSHPKKFHLLGFTLVELIVVITILAILATIAFLSFGGYSSSARDANRLSDLTNIRKGLNLYQTTSGNYPLPTTPVNITSSGAGNIIEYQGYAGDNVLALIKMSNSKDPLDTTPYTYATNFLRTKAQVLGFLEDGTNVNLSYEDTSSFGFPGFEGVTNTVVPTTYADLTDYSKRYPVTKGDSLGILLSSGTLVPVQATGTGVDVTTTGSGYTAILGNKSSDQISGTGIVLKKVEAINILVSSGRDIANVSDISNGSLVGYWDMSTLTSDGKLKDLSGNGNDGTANGGISIGGVSGNGNKNNNKATYFNGISNSMSTGNNNMNFGITGGFSVATWFRSPNVETLGSSWDNPIVYAPFPASNPPTSDFFEFSIRRTNDPINKGKIFCYSFSEWLVMSTTRFDDDSWHYANCVIDRTSQQVKLYIDGVLNSSSSITAYASDNYSFLPSLILGNGNQGYIDELRVYNRTLSDSEILTLYNTTK